MIYDAHCHIIDHAHWPENLHCAGPKPDKLIVMSTGLHDIDKMREAVEARYETIIPAFGYHPWFSHLVYINEPETKASHYKSVLYPEPDDSFINLLPLPIAMDTFVAKMESCLNLYPKAIIGELGLDKPFRLRHPNDSNKLTKYRVRMDHQIAVLRKQLEVAEKFGRPLSLHGVQCHGLLYQEVSKFKDIPAVCLHSYSGSTDQLKMWIANHKSGKVYISFSSYFSLANKNKLNNLLQVLPEENILTESDAEQASLNTIFEHNTAVLNFVAENKKWSFSDTEDRISRNFNKFIA